MKGLVTGANGLLGANVTAELLSRGHQVRALVRRPGAMPLRHSRLQECVGRITDMGEVAAAARGCAAVVHAAALTTQGSRSHEAYAKVNVEGTRLVARAAAAEGIRRMVLVSSANTLGHGSLEHPGHEQLSPRKPFRRSAYARSKRVAEEAAWEEWSGYPGTLVIVHPTFLIGAYDSRPSSGRILLRAYRRRLVFMPPGGKNFVAARDAAAAICMALEAGKHGQHYLLAGSNLSYRQFYRLLNQVSEQRSLLVTIPRPLMMGIGLAGSILARCGLPNECSLNNMRILCLKNYYTPRKAMQELGLRNTPLAQAIGEALDWFRQAGMLPPERGAAPRSTRPDKKFSGPWG